MCSLKINRVTVKPGLGFFTAVAMPGGDSSAHLSVLRVFPQVCEQICSTQRTIGYRNFHYPHSFDAGSVSVRFCRDRARQPDSRAKNSRRSEGEYNLRPYVATFLEETQEGSPENYLTLTSICFGFASLRFGKVTKVTISRPSLNSARTLVASMNVGSVKLLRNSP